MITLKIAKYFIEVRKQDITQIHLVDLCPTYAQYDKTDNQMTAGLNEDPKMEVFTGLEEDFYNTKLFKNNKSIVLLIISLILSKSNCLPPTASIRETMFM